MADQAKSVGANVAGSGAGSPLDKARAARKRLAAESVDLSDGERQAVVLCGLAAKAFRFAARKIRAGGRPSERSVSQIAASAAAAIAELA